MAKNNPITEGPHRKGCPKWLPDRYCDAWREPWDPKVAKRKTAAYLKLLDEHGYITPNFTWHEASGAWRNHLGSDVPNNLKPNARRTAWKLEELRHELGDKAIELGSWYRNKAHNTDVGGATQSRHMQGDAVDITLGAVNALGGAKKFDPVADRIFSNGGFGQYPGGARHVDTRGTRARWTSF